jgi:hypothetical protein
VIRYSHHEGGQNRQSSGWEKEKLKTDFIIDKLERALRNLLSSAALLPPVQREPYPEVAWNPGQPLGRFVMTIISSLGTP